MTRRDATLGEACACMGPPPGEEFCYCQRKAMGLSTKYYEWTEDDKKRLNEILKKAFGWKETP